MSYLEHVGRGVEIILDTLSTVFEFTGKMIWASLFCPFALLSMVCKDEDENE
jgi:hypothetical protein